MVTTSTTFQKDSSVNDKNVKQDMAEEQIEEPNFSDPEDFTDDINDSGLFLKKTFFEKYNSFVYKLFSQLFITSELLEDVLKAKPNEEESLEAVVVVDGIPKVGQDKQPRLKQVLDKVFQKVGKVLSAYYPEGPNAEMSDQITTKGYVRKIIYFLLHKKKRLFRQVYLK